MRDRRSRGPERDGDGSAGQLGLIFHYADAKGLDRRTGQVALHHLDALGRRAPAVSRGARDERSEEP
ncbi:hypothetical protein ACWFRK_17410 [Streptomyces sp. NPDC055157]